MKSLDNFTTARLEEFIRQPLENGLTRSEQMELARIALAAKRTETIYFIYTGGGDYYGYAFVDKNENEIDIKDNQKLYLFPPISQLNHPEIPEGWALVPIEPTLAMLTLLGLTGSFESMLERYANMLDAAPEKPL